MIDLRVTTARQFKHERPKIEAIEEQPPQERGPHRSREQVGTLKAALITVSKPGQASAAAMQCVVTKSKDFTMTY